MWKDNDKALIMQDHEKESLPRWCIAAINCVFIVLFKNASMSFL